MFQIKNFNSIMASLINNANALSDDLTDFNIGSKNRTILEAVAREVDQFYQNLLKGLYEAIPVSIYKSFSFSRLPAAPASGYVTFTRAAGTSGSVSIPEATQVKVPNTDVIYKTTGAATIQSGSDTVDAYVVALTDGTGGNAAANTITEMVSSVTGVGSVTNQNGFTNGVDEESDYNRKVRFQQWVNNLSRATRKSIEYGAKTAVLTDSNGIVTERVTKCLVHEPCIDDNPAGDPGFINVYIWNGSAGGSTQLCAEVSKVLHGYTNDDGTRVPGWKGAGIIASVLPCETETLNVTIGLQAASNYEYDPVKADVEEAIDSMFQALDIGEKFIVSKMIDTIMEIPGVYDVQVTEPTANYTPNWKKITVKGTVTVNQIY